MLAALVLAAGIGSCGGGTPAASGVAEAPTTTAPAASLPAPSASLAPTPEPTTDTAAKLLSVLRSPAFTARMTIKITERVPSGIYVDGQPGPSVSDLVLKSSGQAIARGDNYAFRLQVDGQDKLVWAEVRSGTKVWRRDFADHLEWAQLTATEDPDHARLFAVLRSLTALEPAGTATVGGQNLLRFRAPAATTLDAVTILYKAQAEGKPDTGTLEILARQDGTPVQVNATLSSDDFNSGLPLPSGVNLPNRTYEFVATLTDVGSAVAVPDAAESLAAYTLPRFHVSLRGPLGWEVTTEDPDWDYLESAAASETASMRATTSTASAADAKDQDKFLENAVRSAVADYEKAWGATLVGGEELKIDGLRGYVFEITSPSTASDRYTMLEAVVVKARTAYFIDWYNTPGNELADWLRFERILATVKVG